MTLLTLGIVGFVSADDPRATVERDPPARNTLVGLQGYHDEGRVLELAPDGTVVWEYTALDDVFDVEALGPNRVQVAGAEALPDRQCPRRYRNDGFRGCVRNSVRIVDQQTNDTRWQYAWFDVERHEHELHDVDRYTTAEGARWVLADMGNDRVFAIDRSGEIQWQWNANETYDPPPKVGPEDDWTHVNDVDRVGDERFQVSLRNFDTVIELRVRNDSVSVAPVVGPNRYTPNGSAGPLHEQHNPDRLASGHLLIADSENNRVVEFDGRKRVWAAGGSAHLDWPRDADRLANGHTLVADSYNDRVVELDSTGEVVWAVETGRLPYDVDRVPTHGAGEGSTHRPTADDANFDSRTNTTNPVLDTFQYGITLVKYTIPGWLGRLSLIVGGLLYGIGALFETWRWRRTERRG